jgi:hypothetical protein
MNDQVKTTAASSTAASSSSDTITVFTSDNLPTDVLQQILECLSTYELVTGIGTSARWLRKLCLLHVKEVHIVIPALQHASDTARLHGRDAGRALLLDLDYTKWTEWTKQEGGKLANGLLGQLPNVEVIHGLWNSYSTGILGEALCQLNKPRSKLQDFSHRTDEDFLHLTHYRQEFVVPMARAIAAGLLPSLTRVDSNLSLARASLMKVFEAISEGHLPNLVELYIDLEDVPKKSKVVEALAAAYSHRLQVQGIGGAKQAKLSALEISGIDDERMYMHLLELLRSRYTQDLKILQLMSDYRENLFTTALSYICAPEALASKRPHLQELTLPYADNDDGLMDKFFEALTIHQVCPNLQFLGLFAVDPETLPLLAQFHNGGAFCSLRELYLGQLNEEDAPFVKTFLRRVSETPNKGAALKCLMGANVNTNSRIDVLAAAFSDGLKAGAFPCLEELKLWNVFECRYGIQHLIDAMTAVTPAVETCRNTLRCLHINNVDAEEEAALRDALGGEELKIVSY